MPTIVTHALLPLIASLALRHRPVSKPLLALGMLAAAVPDADIASFAFGIPYAHELGHRGASHSLVFALVLGAGAAVAATRLRASRDAAFLFVASSAASHGLTDMLTNGGKGVALLWPLDSGRYFFAFTPVEVSPIGVSRFLSGQGLAVLWSELCWIVLPLLLVALLIRFAATPASVSRR